MLKDLLLLFPSSISAHVPFFAMFMLAFWGVRFPFLKNVLRWFETFFHEISHALVTVCTFGKASQLQLHWKGGGRVLCQGGAAVPILMAGYMGSTLWGLIIYFAGYGSAQVQSTFGPIILGGILAFIFISLLWLVRDFITCVILLIIASVLTLPFYAGKSDYAPQILQFIGLSISLNALRAPLFLLYTKNTGDGSELAKRTLIPELLWVLIWVLFGAVGLLLMWQISIPPEARLSFFPSF